MSFDVGPVSSAGGDDVALLYVDFSRTDFLQTGDIAATPVVTQVSGTTLNIANAAINVADVTIRSRTATANKSVKFTVTPDASLSGDVDIYISIAKADGYPQTFEGTVKVAVAL